MAIECQDPDFGTERSAYREVWDCLETPQTQPRRMRNVVVTEWRDFADRIWRADEAFATETVSSFYLGDVYVLKNAFPQGFMPRVREGLHEHGLRTPSSFHKMLEACPNFHRIIDEAVNREQKYAFESVKHSYFFFLWNDDPFSLWPVVLERWRAVKLLGGRGPRHFETNTPKNGIVERLQMAHYPSGTGSLELHSDPYLFARIIFSGIMTTRGVHFGSGGVYFLDRADRKVDIESYLQEGDLYLAYPTIHHGIDTIDPGTPVDWSSVRGRWWMGIFTNHSDHVQDRHTGYAIRNQRA